jgi:hypothetical protein
MPLNDLALNKYCVSLTMKIYIQYIIICCIPNLLFAQGITIKNNTDESYLLDRYEIGSGTLLHPFNLTDKSIGAADVVSFLEAKDGIKTISRIDAFNKNNLFTKHQEYSADENSEVLSKKPILKNVYKTPSNFFAYKDDKVVAQKICLSIRVGLHYMAI